MPDFILYDRETQKARAFTSDDWFLGCVDTIRNENPAFAPVPVTDAEPRARFSVFVNSPGLDKALAKAKAPEDVPKILEENGAVMGYVFLDRPSQG
jgi:hypothetical protein